MILILVLDLLLNNGGVGDEGLAVQVFFVEIYGGDLVVIVGGVIINPPGQVAAAGVEGDFVFVFFQSAQAALLVHAAENVEELADGVYFILWGQGV